MPTPKQIEYRTIAHLVEILALMCAASPEKIIELLTGYLFDEEEAALIEQALKDNNG